jgi:DNA-binding PadR family transcriptional regulator
VISPPSRASDPSTSRTLGRYVEPALWVLIALDDGARPMTAMFDAVRTLDGPIGHGTLIAAVSRLERLDLVESTVLGAGRRAYRLTRLGAVAAGGAATMKGRPT